MMIVSVINSYGQDLSRIGKEKPLRLSGSTSLNQVYYNSSLTGRGRDPYVMVLTGNLNVDLYGWSIAMSYMYSNQNSAFQQPFNQFSLHPTYKGITAHLGFASMTFSPYTLSGHIFLGAGVEVTPEKGRFKYAAMYGRLLKAVEADTITQSAPTPSFDRIGFGFKTTYEHNGDQVEVILFKSKDDENSITYIPDDEELLPEENLVMSIKGEKQLFSRFKLSAEYASSAITRDVRASTVDKSPNNAFAYVGGLFTQRTSTSYYGAFKTSFGYTVEAFNLGVNYERIDPGYETHGAYFFNNDMENVTVNFGTRFWNKKANLSTNVGVQRNNLDNDKLSQMKRFVGSVNVGAAPTEKLNVSASYSNFQSFTNIRSQFDYINATTPYENYDTLNYQQVNHTINLNGSYFLGSPSAENKKMLTANLSYNRGNDEQGSTKNVSIFYNSNVAFNTNFTNSGLGVTVSMNFTKVEMATASNLTYGPTLTVNKSFVENKIRTSFSAAYNSSYTDEAKTGDVLNFRLTGGYKIGKHQNLNASIFNMHNNTQMENQESFRELTATMSYVYSF